MGLLQDCQGLLVMIHADRDRCVHWIFEHTIILLLISNNIIICSSKMAAENLELLNFSLLKCQLPSLCVFTSEHNLFWSLMICRPHIIYFFVLRFIFISCSCTHGKLVINYEDQIKRRKLHVYWGSSFFNNSPKMPCGC